MGRKNTRVFFESEHLRVTRTSSKGVGKPARIKIEMLEDVGEAGHFWQFRRLDLTVDELFDLAETLDDLCDHIEDREIPKE
jgi:hypothetical protein